MESIDSQHATELRQGERFAFGVNWQRFLAGVTRERIDDAIGSLGQMLDRESLDGLTFLDVGSGSGLLSLAAYRLGASVHSFDFDPQSVACTAELRRRFGCDDSRWRVEAGSILDAEYVAKLGKFDIVYSWGVLHHTGDLRSALENAMKAVVDNGALFIALYNDQGWLSKYWRAIKRQFNTRPSLRPALVLLHAPYLLVGRLVARALRGHVRAARGMSLWYDMIDWLGGWPFEVSRPSDIVAFCESSGFEALKVIAVGNRPGCNEFVFRKTPVAA
jgi:2-polyprenyl-6-hydroxyphenyl methylase/3-demethylubiquinone-9 3-methyltransferase